MALLKTICRTKAKVLQMSLMCIMKPICMMDTLMVQNPPRMGSQVQMLDVPKRNENSTYSSRPPLPGAERLLHIVHFGK